MRSFKCDTEKIYYINNYEPYTIQNIRNINFNKKTGGYMLDLKQNKDCGINYYYDLLEEEFQKIRNINEFDIITIVPSSKQYEINCGMIKLVRRLEQKFNFKYVQYLQRHTTVKKKANGGARSKEQELNTISCSENNLINKRIILIDDVTTTGTSLISCKEILCNKQAKSVVCLGISKTVKY